ncbi:anhydro-N-acetylmuramic acid kinase [Thermoactinospora rubra]|uniref:anhydro-N-acetylmuramic acid kinase n=1 Tax=Thermoactinospora rubra TaxID=1088767 RepID=UPI000A100743|nr:anhydro-N-acetylmuramic acid kinase [Thermoactinospora rubra]
MRVLGLISGTSHDGVDHAVVDWRLADGVLTGVVERAGETPYPPDLRERIVRALPPGRLDMAEVCALDTLIGQVFAEVAGAAATAGTVDLICSHGQTLYHWVADGRVRGTLQLGQPAWIAERTGVPVVSDLRARDVAAGGQGAPLVSYLDLMTLPERAGALNLGGIANLTVRDAGLAYDTGPGCALIDAAAPPYDADGRLAAAGKVDEGLLAELLKEPYYRREPPKTTGKELFTPGYVAGRVKADLPLEDLVATLTALTAETAAAEIRRHDLELVVVSGGGARNPTLLRMLRERVSAEVVVSEIRDVKEAVAFSLLGWLTAHGLPATVPGCTGAAGPRVLGTITPGAGPLRLPAPLEAGPERVVLRTPGDPPAGSPAGSTRPTAAAAPPGWA